MCPVQRSFLPLMVHKSKGKTEERQYKFKNQGKQAKKVAAGRTRETI